MKEGLYRIVFSLSNNKLFSMSLILEESVHLKLRNLTNWVVISLQSVYSHKLRSAVFGTSHSKTSFEKLSRVLFVKFLSWSQLSLAKLLTSVKLTHCR